MPGCWRRFLIAAWFASCSILPAWAAERRASEAEVKAAIVFNVLLFVNWPQSPDALSHSLRVCFVEDSAAANAMHRQFKEERVGRARLEIENLSESRNDVRTCNAVFVGGGNSSSLYKAAVAAQDRPILVMGEGPMAIENGAMIGLVLVRDFYSIEINLTALRSEKLSLSSKLIRMARKVIQ